jgi:hypothetical protein
MRSGGQGVPAALTPATLLGKSHLYIPFLGIARPHSQFPHSCVCERFTVYIHTIALPILLPEICEPIQGIYKSLTDT